MIIWIKILAMQFGTGKTPHWQHSNISWQKGTWHNGINGIKGRHKGTETLFLKERDSIGFGIYKWSNKSSSNVPRKILFDNIIKWEPSTNADQEVK
jgi:hypothetical protein